MQVEPHWSRIHGNLSTPPQSVWHNALETLILVLEPVTTSAIYDNSCGKLLASKRGLQEVLTCVVQAIKNFCREIGITRSDGEIHLHKLEHHIRADLDANSPRMLAVLRPLRVVLTNLLPDHLDVFQAKVSLVA